MKVLVTGATGLVGREIGSKLLNYGIDTVLSGRGERYCAEGVDILESNYIRADITDKASLSRFESLEKVDAVVHCAGLAHQFGNTERREFEKVNVGGTENILELAVKMNAAHFILISSTAVYGINKPTVKDGSTHFIRGIDENDECRPATPYAETKLGAEEKALGICAENNIPLTIFRLAPVVGAGGEGNVARLLRAVDKKRFVWVGDGGNLKSMIYKRDVAGACLKLLLEKKAEIEIFNLAAKPVSMKQLVERIAETLERKIPPLNISPSLARFIFKLNNKTAGIKKIERIARSIEKWLSDDVYSAEKIASAYDFRTETSILDAVEKQALRYKFVRGERK